MSIQSVGVLFGLKYVVLCLSMQGSKNCYVCKVVKFVVGPQIRGIYAIVCKAWKNVNVCTVDRCVIGPQIRSIYAIVCKAWKNVNVCTVDGVLLGLKYVVSMQ